MAEIRCPMTGEEILENYFLENRDRLLEIATFLDRVDRSDQAAWIRQDYRYRAFMRALERVSGRLGRKAFAAQMIFSDLSSEPIADGAGLKATGAWEKSHYEDY